MSLSTYQNLVLQHSNQDPNQVVTTIQSALQDPRNLHQVQPLLNLLFLAEFRVTFRFTQEGHLSCTNDDLVSTNLL